MRNYGRFTTSIWRDPDFTSLRLDQQAVYFTLGLQPDVSAAGLLPYTARRWAKLSAGATRDQIEALVTSLAEHSGLHLVVDEDSEELLIRKFIKWDMGWLNSKRLPVVVEAVRAISSPTLRDAAVDELRKLAVSDMASPDAREAVSDAITTFDRVVVTEGEYVPQPLTATLEGEPFGEDAEPLSPFCSKHPTGTEKSCGPCGTAKLRYAEHVKATAGREADAKRRLAEMRRACTECDDNGFALDGDGISTTFRCSHDAIRAAS